MPTFATETGTIAYELLEARESPAPARASVPTLTLLHNFMSTGRTAWGPLVPALNQRYRILLPDLPGHGASVGYPQAFAHNVIAEQLGALMHEVGAENGHLAGCSSGGMVAQRMVQQGVVQPASLTLVSTTYSTNPITTGVTDPITPERFKAGRNWLEGTAKLHDPLQGEGYFESILLPGFRALNPVTSIDLSPDDLRAISLPVCIIQGDEDEFFPVAIVEQMAAGYPDVETHLIPGQTHALLFRAPQKVADLMLAFLAQT